MFGLGVGVVVVVVVVAVEAVVVVVVVAAVVVVVVVVQGGPSLGQFIGQRGRNKKQERTYVNTTQMKRQESRRRQSSRSRPVLNLGLRDASSSDSIERVLESA